MSMRFRYEMVHVNQPVISLGGRWVRPRPVVQVTIVGPQDARLRDAVLDPASDDTVFPEALARTIGIDLSTAPIGQAVGVGGRPIPVRFAQVKLRLADHHEQHEWPAWVGFTSAQWRNPLLGFAGCLQYFSATFHGDLEVAELSVNRLYPGT